MKTAGGIIGLIGAIFGFFAAIITLMVGGFGSSLEADGADVIVALGWGGVFFSFLAIILSAIGIKAKGRLTGILLVLCSIAGMVLGGTLVAICMLLPLIAGILCALKNEKQAVIA